MVIIEPKMQLNYLNRMRFMRSRALVETEDSLILNSYIGRTRNSILTRLNQHKQNGPILEHMATCHNYIKRLTNRRLNIQCQYPENDS